MRIRVYYSIRALRISCRVLASVFIWNCLVIFFINPKP